MFFSVQKLFIVENENTVGQHKYLNIHPERTTVIIWINFFLQNWNCTTHCFRIWFFTYCSVQIFFQCL